MYSSSTTAPCRQGAVKVSLTRATAVVTWDGNADTALKVYCLNSVANSAGGRNTAIDYQARTNYDTTKICGVEGNTRVSSGAACPTMYGINHTCEIYGTVATALYGLYMDMRNEGAAATTSAGLLVNNSNASLATTIGSALRVTKGATNLGFDYLIDANSTDALNTAVMSLYDDGTVCNDTNATGCFANGAGYLTVVVGAATRYIHLSSAAPTA
jgi:hypothetical protein